MYKQLHNKKQGKIQTLGGDQGDINCGEGSGGRIKLECLYNMTDEYYNCY